MPTSQRAILIVLDGFGIGKDSPFNAIANARKPFFNELLQKYPHSELLTHGLAVGLPEGVMGNSEVGHMTMGAGRVIYQDLTRIAKEIAEKNFFKNAVIRKTFQTGAEKTGRVHLMGLVSDGGVHSHIDHLLACLTLAQEMRIPEVFVHMFTDGRDTSPTSSARFLKRVQEHPLMQATKESGSRARIASLGGRYYAMDRDQRWDRVKRAYDAMTGQAPLIAVDAAQLIQASYQNDKKDEFIEPTLILEEGAIRDGDSLFFFNYRSDRAREITAPFVVQEFADFDRGKNPQVSAFAGMTQYDAKLPSPIAYGPQNLNNLLPSWLEQKKLTQFRIAETEKYAHVTFFFNGGREAPFIGEDRFLVPSVRDVPTYDLKPEMSADGIAEEAARRILLKQYDFMLMNFANADMVGHTGNYEATVRAIETLDRCVAKVIGAAERSGYHTILTADHGNAEEMCDSEGHAHTQHSLNPVPAIWVAPNTAAGPRASRVPMKDGGLADIMPTICDLMNLPLPSEVTGTSLLEKRAE